MPSPTSTTLLHEARLALESFTTSRSPFRLIRTVPSAPSRTTPSTLFILDSSFNPPSNAHLALALSALAPHPSQHEWHRSRPTPHSLLLLFSTHNADKSPSPAPFEHRLATMVRFAEDIARLPQLQDANALHVDVGLTTQPFYSDKSAAIDESGVYGGAQHVHLVGFDTFERIFTAKYYKGWEPPLSALDGFFERHGLLVMLRAGVGDPDDGVRKQRGWLDNLREGKMEKEGAKRKWTEKIEMVEEPEMAVGVSSTDVRRGIEMGDASILRKLCTAGVASWVEEWKLYQAEKE